MKKYSFIILLYLSCSYHFNETGIIGFNFPQYKKVIFENENKEITLTAEQINYFKDMFLKLKQCESFKDLPRNDIKIIGIKKIGFDTYEVYYDYKIISIGSWLDSRENRMLGISTKCYKLNDDNIDFIKRLIR